MSRRIVPWPHPCLRRPADPIVKITPEIEDIWHDMISVMEAMPGVGLAAPQLGIGLRLAGSMPPRRAERFCAWPTLKYCMCRLS